MLSLLHIRNIAVIEECEIHFQDGFNALTGETGAGKSIVIDSISAILGERTSRDLIRTGAERAEVEALFSDLKPNTVAKLQDLGAEPDEDGNLVCSREITKEGKNICRINGRISTVSQLREVGRQLVNIHGQHESQQLLDEQNHLGYLDLFGQCAEEKTAYQKLYQELRSVEAKLESLKIDEGEKARRIDALQFQIQELEEAELKPGEESELRERREILRNSEKISEAISAAYIALAGDEDTDGASSLLNLAEEKLSRIGNLSDDFSKLAESVNELYIACEDLSETLRDRKEEAEGSPKELEDIEERLDLLYRLKRKYGNSEEEMLAYLEKCRNELDEIEFSDKAAEKLNMQKDQLQQKAQAAADLLTGKREKAAQQLESRIHDELTALDMPKVRFHVEMEKAEGLLAEGQDRVRFLLSANAGEDLKPLQRIASGGELSRIMLAMKNVMAENDGIDTLIFDEIDSGISGNAAFKVAVKMAEISRCKQVLCVTHLPQMAAMADTQFSVSKREDGGRTYTQVRQLTNDERVLEVAHLFGGERPTQAMQQAAEELLQKGKRFHQE